ncbi:MAG: nucleoside triphosphate pyrophosphohydrolase [Clostridia bacterium]|nr:nucleoside triphosphate pyrophosphohydrolase [Clostridia bacterium]
MDFQKKAKYDINDLVEIMKLLRSENGCPWDREQTHESIRMNLLEEAYEACDAIDNKNDANLKEELGDVLMQVVFHSRIAEEAGKYNFDDVADDVCQKLVFRHPHVFGDVGVNTSDEVLDVWDQMKLKEKKSETYTDEMERVPKALPSLMYSEKIQKRARKAGFDWPDVSGALEKVYEETKEVEQAIKEGSKIEEEIGDLLFAVVNVARFCKVDCEQALYNASQKFTRRFAYVEEKAGENLKNMSLEEMDKLWNEYKKVVEGK